MSLEQLAPGLLLAAPRLGDPNFERTVVLLGKHDAEGALGWVLNGQEVMQVSELFTEAELVPHNLVLPIGPRFSAMARVGGPVASDSGWLIYPRRADQALREHEVAIGEELVASGAVEVFDALMRGHGPEEFRVLLGYAGWGPGQLDSEVQAGAWLPAPLDAAEALNGALDDLDQLWESAYRRTIGTGPGAFTSGRGSA